jgi:subtilisin family serine protease
MMKKSIPKLILLGIIFILVSSGFNNSVSKNVSFTYIEHNRTSTNYYEKSNQSSKSIIQEKGLFEPEFALGEIIVKFKDNISLNLEKTQNSAIKTGINSIDKLNEYYNVTDFRTLFQSRKKTKENISYLTNIYLLSFSGKSDVLSDIKKYQNNENVEYAEPNYIVKGSVIPNDPYFSLQWALNNEIYDADIDAPEAWEIEKGKSNVTIAIIDSGVDYTHPDLAENIWINQAEYFGNTSIDDDENGYADDLRGWDFVNNDSDPIDDYGHGTHCSGIVSAVTNNSIGIAGVSWSSKIMALKGLNDEGVGYTANLSEAIYYAADNGADVISMSWGSYAYSETLKNTLDYAFNNNVVLVAAAGNYDTNSTHYPAGYDHVISVAATNNHDEKAEFSNWGPWIDVAAPGVDIYSTMPTYHVTLNDQGYSKNYSYMSGTSMSCPFVAGIAALLLSKNPNLHNDDIIKIFKRGIDPCNASNYNPEYIGRGRINANESLKIDTLSNATAKIVSPSWFDVFSRNQVTNLEITGDAVGDNFMVKYGKGTYPHEWTMIATGIPQSGSFVVLWNIENLEDGVYMISLTVNDSNGNSTDWVEIYISPMRLEWKSRFGCNLFNAPIAEDLDLDGRKEIVLYDNDINGMSNKLVCLNGTTGDRKWEYPLHDNFSSFPLQAIGDIDNDGKDEILAASNYRDTGRTKGCLYAIDADGNLIWQHPFDFGGITSYISLIDTNKDNKLEILVGSVEGIYCFNCTGDILWFCGLEKAPESFAVGYINYDGFPEIIASGLYHGFDDAGNVVYCINHLGAIEWSYTLNGNRGFTSPPILGDVNGDYFLEIIIAGDEGTSSENARFLYCLNTYGILEWKSSEVVWSIIDLSAADFNGDDIPEIICSRDDGYICMYDGNGTEIWETNYPGAACYPIIADYNNDGKLDLFGGCLEGMNNEIAYSHTFALNDSGNYEWFYPPLHGWTINPFFIGDIDNDGLLEILVHPSAYPDSDIFCFEIGIAGGKLAWPMFQHDAQHTGLCDQRIKDEKPPVIDIKKPAQRSIYLAGNYLLKRPFFQNPIIIGKITVQTTETDNETGIDRVEFYVDDVLKKTVSSEPFSWVWDERTFSKHTLRVVAYDKVGNSAIDQSIVWKFF